MNSEYRTINLEFLWEKEAEGKPAFRKHHPSPSHGFIERGRYGSASTKRGRMFAHLLQLSCSGSAILTRILGDPIGGRRGVQVVEFGNTKKLRLA